MARTREFLTVGHLFDQVCLGDRRAPTVFRVVSHVLNLVIDLTAMKECLFCSVHDAG
ncbi:MAG TPA: hypothetical protein VFD58_28590 [Blastocatellia bacterium]|nr:hypothetical protein [Blastocatellia bacterium]